MEMFTLPAILSNLVLGIVRNRIDAGLTMALVAFCHCLRQDKQKLYNGGLQKALRCSFLSSLQAIALECHRSLLGPYPIKYRGQLVYPPECSEELLWLDKKLRQLAKDLKTAKISETAEIPLERLDDIACLLHDDGSINRERLEAVKERLVENALGEEEVPELYAQKVKAELFELLSDRFATEIKYTPDVRELVESQWLSQLNAKLDSQQLSIERIEEALQSKESREADAASLSIHLNMNIEELDIPKLEAVIDSLKGFSSGEVYLKLSKVEAGSVLLTLESDRVAGELIESLFQSGELSELAGIPVLAARLTLPLGSREQRKEAGVGRTLNNLSQWLDNILAEGWQTVEYFLNQDSNLAFSFAGAIRSREDELERLEGSQKAIKQYDLGERSVALVVKFARESNQEIAILLQVYPAAGTHLPPHLELMVLDEGGDNFLEARSGAADNCIQLEFSGEPGERFTIKIALGDASVAEAFAF